jgi:hypothetical protein
VSITKGSPLGGQASSSGSAVPERAFTLRDLYQRASISGNSLAVELDQYLNIDATTSSSSSEEDTTASHLGFEPSVHEKALAAILEVVTSNSKAMFEHVRAPEPQGGVQEWWSRMLSGSLNNSEAAIGCHVTGESR